MQPTGAVFRLHCMMCGEETKKTDRRKVAAAAETRRCLLHRLSGKNRSRPPTHLAKSFFSGPKTGIGAGDVVGNRQHPGGARNAGCIGAELGQRLS